MDAGTQQVPTPGELAALCRDVDASLDPAQVLAFTGARDFADLVANIKSASDLDVLVGTAPGQVTIAVRDRLWTAISVAQAAQAKKDNYPSTPSEEAIQRLEDAMRQLLGRIPAMAVAVVRNGSVVYSGAVGEAAGVPADAEKTMFMTASISKTMNAVLCLQMVERGELELDMDINHYISISVRNPHFPDAPVTVRHLLTHTSSLRDSESAVNIGGQWKVYSVDCAVTLEEYVRRRLLPDSEERLWSPHAGPGAVGWRYSNAGMTLLGWVIECVAGRPLPELAQERIFDVANMARSKYTLAEAQGLPDTSLAEPHKRGRAVGHYGLAEFPAAGLRSTAVDLARFLQQLTSHENHLFSSEDSMREMLPVDYRRGLAWWGLDATYGEGEPGLWTHGGLMEGVRTHIYLYPEKREGIVVLTNAEEEDYKKLHWYAYEVLHPPEPLP